MRPVFCQECNKKIDPSTCRDRSEYSKRKFCSRECYQNSRKTNKSVGIKKRPESIRIRPITHTKQRKYKEITFVVSEGKKTLQIKLKRRKKCINCYKIVLNNHNTFCSIECAVKYKERLNLALWLKHDISGNKQSGGMQGFVRRYIFKKYNNRCAECGWHELNPYTKTLPLEIHHRDGNSSNSFEENLILLCPNCHSLTKTYKAANWGHGRKARRERYHREKIAQ